MYESLLIGIKIFKNKKSQREPKRKHERANQEFEKGEFWRFHAESYPDLLQKNNQTKLSNAQRFL